MNSEIGEVFRASSLKEALAGMIILSWRFKGIIEETLKERKRLTVGMKPFTVDDFNDTLEIAAMSWLEGASCNYSKMYKSLSIALRMLTYDDCTFGAAPRRQGQPHRMGYYPDHYIRHYPDYKTVNWYQD